MGSRRRARVMATVAAALQLAACQDGRRDAAEVCAQPDTFASPATSAVPLPRKSPPFRALLFSRHIGYSHQSTPAATAALQVVGAYHGFTVEPTEDAGRFTDEGLRPYRVVIFLGTSGDVLDEAQEAAFTRYVRAGGGFVGVHSASDTEQSWDWYHRLVGVHFSAHPPIQRARLVVNDRSTPSTNALPQDWVRTDEWYDYRSPPPPGARILVSVDETSYSGGRMGASHPVSWAQLFEGGRSWYTAMGHTACAFTERAFLEHLAGGVVWAAGVGNETS